MTISTQDVPQGADLLEQTGAISCRDLRNWVREARPNARLVYGNGACASTCCSKPLRELVMDLAARGYVTPHTIRLGAERRKVQVIQRTARPVLKGAML